MSRVIRVGALLCVVTLLACTIDITMPERAPTYWCYSDSLKAVRDSFPYCPPDTLSRSLYAH